MHGPGILMTDGCKAYARFSLQGVHLLQSCLSLRQHNQRPKQPCLQHLMMCKECKQFGRVVYTRCDWLTREAVHAHKPSATCSLHLYHIASFEQAAAGHAALPGHMCDIQGFPLHSPPPPPPPPPPPNLIDSNGHKGHTDSTTSLVEFFLAES